MAVAVIMDFDGGTLDQYDQVIGKMGFSPGGSTPPGALFHWVTKTDDGVRVVDVWESQEQLQAFAEEQIGPYTQEVGLPEPATHFHQVHNHLTAS